MRLTPPKVYADEKLTLTFPGHVARELRAYLAYYRAQGVQWGASALLASVLEAFAKGDRDFIKWKKGKGDELDQLIAAESLDGARKEKA